MSDTVIQMIRGVRAGDSVAQHRLWDVYFQKLVALSRHRIANRRFRDLDEEDVALSAMNSFFRAVDEDRLTKLDDHDDLWKILVVITARKVSNHTKRAMAEKRGPGRIRGESIFMRLDRDDQQMGLHDAPDAGPTPDDVVEVTETCEQMLSALSDDSLREIARMKLEGYSNREIGVIMNCAERTVERKLERIRTIWSDSI